MAEKKDMMPALAVGICVVGVAAVFVVMLAKNRGISSYVPREYGPAYIEGVKMTVPRETEAIVPTQGLLHYKNKETREVEWNEDGLPTRITIEREYYQLP